jgi:hypothetical protein
MEWNIRIYSFYTNLFNFIYYKTAKYNPFKIGCSRDFWPKIIRLNLERQWRTFGQFLAENISFEFGKTLMIDGLGVYLKLKDWKGGYQAFMVSPGVSARNVLLGLCAWEF